MMSSVASGGACAWRQVAAMVLLAVTAWAAVAQTTPVDTAPTTITMASTTSTEQSGLFAHLLPAFEKYSGIHIHVIAVGTGQAIDIGRRGDADVLLVHDPVAEEQFVAEGFSLQRYPVMYNDFVLLGPPDDPAAVRGLGIVDALRAIAHHNALFISRGDHSGTHAAELRYWAMVPLQPRSGPGGYRACGCGMGQALMMAREMGAYVLADRGTWLAFRSGGALAILVQGDQQLFNQYGVLVVNPQRFPWRNTVAAQRFADWVTGPDGQAVIASYQIGGQPLFFPNARHAPAH